MNLKKSFREGISPKGHYYYPAFPFYFFSRVTDDDVAAIKAYLDAIPAVHKKNYDNEMIFPFNFRLLQLGWRILFFDTAKFQPFQINPQRSPQWNRGAYLVLGLGHCDMCHTQSYYLLFKGLVLGAPDMKYHLGGSFVQGYYAPDITSRLMKNATDQQLSDVFKKIN